MEKIVACIKHDSVLSENGEWKKLNPGEMDLILDRVLNGQVQLTTIECTKCNEDVAGNPFDVYDNYRHE